MREIRIVDNKKLQWCPRNSQKNLIKSSVRISTVLNQPMPLTDRQIHCFISDNEEEKVETKIKNKYKEVHRIITLKFVSLYLKKFLTSKNVLNQCSKIFLSRRYPSYLRMTSFTTRLCFIFSIYYLRLMSINYAKCKKILIVTSQISHLNHRVK